MSYDLAELPSLLQQLYAVVARLEALAPGRKFTPDGHLVGSIGEAVAAYAYGLELLPASVRQHDARTVDALNVQIKLTQGSSVALSYDCDHLLVLQLDRREGFIEIYNGPGGPVWRLIEHKADLGRQRQIRVATLRRLGASVERERIPQVRQFPAVLPAILGKADGSASSVDGQPVAALRKGE